MPYTHTTFSTAKTILAARLGNPSKSWWVDAELGFAITEARRLWNAITLHDRARGRFLTSNNTAFYSLTSNLVDVVDGSTLLRNQTIRDRALVSEIQYHLIEDQGLSAWAGTDQFTLSQVVTAIQRRRDKFLADTASVVSRRTGDAINYDGTVNFPDTVIGLRRAVYRSDTGQYISLQPSDEKMATARQYWNEHGTPASYSSSLVGNLTVKVIPPPIVSGTLESITVNTGATLDTTANSNTGVLLGIQDDYAWGIKYGALADLLRDFSSADPERAESCEQLYALSVQLASIMPVILGASINGSPVNVSSISMTDLRMNGWEGQGTGIPKTLSVVSPDMIALSRTPNSNPHTVELDVVRTAVVPTNDGDYIDIGREHLDAILSMAQRICLFKCGGGEYAATESLAGKFFEEAQKYSYRRSAASSALQAISKTSSRAVTDQEWERVPRVVSGRPEEEIRSERNARRRPFRKQR